MKKVYVTFLALILVTAMILPIGVSYADSPQIVVSGSIYLETPSTGEPKWVGKPMEWIPGVPIPGSVVFMEMTNTIEYYDGSFVGSATEVMEAMKNFVSGAFNSKGIQEFDGEFLGSAGTFTAWVRHQGGMDDVVRIEMTIISGTGACENLHGTLIFIAYPIYDPFPPFIDHYEGTYSGTLHYVP